MAVTWKKLAYEDDVVLEADFDANTILAANDDNTPLALTIAEQEVVGRLTGGNIDGIAIGISDDNIVQVDSDSVADDDYAKWTANGLEGKSYSEVLADLSGQAAAAFNLNDQQLTDFVIHNVADSDARDAEDPVVGKAVFQVDELAVYICTVAA